MHALYLLLRWKVSFTLLSMFYCSTSGKNRLQFGFHLVRCYIFKCRQSSLNHYKWSVEDFFILCSLCCMPKFVFSLWLITCWFLQNRLIKPNVLGGTWLRALLFWGFLFKLYGCYVLWLSQKIFPLLFWWPESLITCDVLQNVFILHRVKLENLFCVCSNGCDGH